MHGFRTACQRVDRESACVAEHVEHPASGAVTPQQFAVVALVHKKACFLSAQPVHMEAQAVFGGYVGVESADNIVVLGVAL